MKKLFQLASLAALLFSTGCASIMSGTTQIVSFQSEPADAKTTIFNKKKEAITIQQTPFTTQLKRGAKYTVKMEKENYEAYEAELKKGFNGAYLGNFIAGGTLGMLVDMGSGAGEKFIDPVKVELASAGSGKLSTLIIPIIKYTQATTPAAEGHGGMGSPVTPK